MRNRGLAAAGWFGDLITSIDHQIVAVCAQSANDSSQHTIKQWPSTDAFDGHIAFLFVLNQPDADCFNRLGASSVSRARWRAPQSQSAPAMRNVRPMMIKDLFMSWK